MSLINEALKKAQRLRNEQPAGAPASGDPAAPAIRKRDRPMAAQSLLLLVAGGAVLVVLSVVLTVYLLNRPPATLPSTVAAPINAAPVVDLDAPSPVIVAPVIPKAADPVTETPPATPAIETLPALTSVPAASPPIEPVAAAPMPASSFAPSPPPPAAHTLQTQQFVDALRVTGIRSSGEDSKVLMNDRVYRVNDVVDRTLGLKLVKVAPDGLTFTDPTGTIYTKNF